MSEVSQDTIVPTDGEHLPPLREGAEIGGRYALERRLGHGAMGEVWSATHTMMKKRVAIKFLHPTIAARQDLVDRFQREAQAAANINHPNICAATDFGKTDDGTFFLVMEFVEGKTLSDLIEERGKLSVEEATRIVVQLCDALSQAHTMGIVHRDLKPDNLMLIPRGVEPNFVKILDFGIAHVEFDESQDEEVKKLTKAGEVFGTPHYMSPEQIGSKAITGASDLYSVGIIYTEMLTGKVPFDADSLFGILEQHVNRMPPRLRELGDVEYPERIQSVVDRLLAKEAEDRYGGADALRSAIFAALPELAPGSSAESPASSVDPVVAKSDLLRPKLPRFTRKSTLGFFSLFFALLAVIVVWANVDDFGWNGMSVFGASLAEQRAEFEKRDEMRPAMDALVEGDVEDALTKLYRLAENEAETPHLYYLIGVSEKRTKDEAGSVKAFVKAVELDPGYAREEALIEGVLECMKTKSCQEYQALGRVMKGGEHDVLAARLVLAARTAKSKRVRSRSKEILERAGLFDELEPWERRSIELVTTSGCKSLKEAITRLAEVGDKRGVEAIRFYSQKPTKGCGLLKLQDCYGCIRKPLKEAAEQLQGI